MFIPFWYCSESFKIILESEWNLRPSEIVKTWKYWIFSKITFLKPISTVSRAVPSWRHIQYCPYGNRKIVHIGTLSFRRILPFWYFCFLKYIKRASLYILKKAEVSKVDYSSKAKSSDVRGVGTLFDTCLNLGHLFPYNFKILYCHFIQNLNSKIHIFCILYGTF
jgi:hypothetical protein